MDLHNETGSTVSVHSGFPNPAAQHDHAGTSLSLDHLLIRHPSSTYYFQLHGHQWADQGIFDGDIAVIDRAVQPVPGDLVIAWPEEQFILARYSQLTSAAEPWGVVTAIVHQFRGRGIETINQEVK